MFDVIVVGGGVAALSSALVLGRSRRRTLVLDAGQPRNAPSAAAHSVFTRDGTSPTELLTIGRDQLRPYPSVQLQLGRAVDAQVVRDGFEVSVSGDGSVRSRKLLLAYGVIDELPQIGGIEELWGKSVLHCPYCHGWEVRDEPLALYGRKQAGMELAQLLLGWSRDLVLCTDGPAELTDEQRAQLARHQIPVIEKPISHLDGAKGVLERICFSNGSHLSRRAMFLRPTQHQRSDLAARLGCEQTELGLIRTDEWGQTSVSGVYAAGDATTPVQKVIRAAASGATAAIGINRSLLAEDFGGLSSD
jgi:thioredoxin reductase